MKTCKRVLMILVLVLSLFSTGMAAVQAQTSASQTSNFANLVLFVQFSDTEGNFMDSKQDTYAQKTYTEAAVHDYLDTSYAKSLVSYMDTISYGQFHVNTYMPQLNEAKNAITPITLTGTQNSYDSYGGIYLAEKEAMNAAKTKWDLTSLNLDQDNNGSVDNVTFIFAGTESARGGTFYAHKNDFDPGYTLANGKDVGCINVLMAETVFGTEFSSTGEIAHEFLHSIGYPDLYHEDGGTPVGAWDIMSQASLYNQWPLAYLRSSVSNWLTIDTVTSSQHLTLVPSSEKDGNQAYILKTSISDSEFFVVEYRKQGKQYSDELDVKIPGSGLIIYRINQRSENLSNRLGNGVDGVYVFRPGETNTTDDAGDMTESFLSSESGRTSYGTEDMSKGIADNAIVYSDGQNSGIAIRNVSSAADTISFDVSFADTSNIGLWNSLGGSSVASNTNSNVLSMAVNGNDSYPSALIGNSSTLALYQYNESSWVKASADITDFNSMATLAYLNGIPYVLYSNKDDFKIKLVKYLNGSWQTISAVSSASNVNDSSMISDGDALYLAWNEVNEDNSSFNNKVKKFDGVNLTDLLYEKTSENGAQFHFSSGGNSVYLSYRNAANHDIATALQITEDTISPLPVPSVGSDQPMICGDSDDLYFLNASESTTGDTYLYQYSDDRKTLKKISASFSEGSSNASSIAIYHGIPMVQVSDNKESGSSGTAVYRFENNAWWQEGLKLDPDYVSNTNMLMIGNTCYVSFLSNSVPYIKTKQITVNQSGQSTPTVASIIASASKTAYKIGDSFNANDLTVKAQYSDFSSKTLTYKNDYSVSGFDTSSAGTKNVTVKYGSFIDTYQITVSAIDVTGVKVNGTLSLTAGNSGQLNAAVSPSNATNKKVSWSSSNMSVASVDGNGKVTAKNAGKASITVATADGNYKASCSVTVSAAPAATPKPTVAGIIIYASKNSYKVGDSFNANDIIVKVKYSDSSTKILSYQTDYTISGFNTSTAGTKTVTVKYGSFTGTYQITVSAIAVTGVKINGTLSLTAGNSGQLNTVISPSNATNKKVSWSSNNTFVASVDSNGKVIAKSAGTAYITVSTADGNYQSVCNVTVSALPVKIVSMNRLYNPNSGEHFYTADTVERDWLVTLGWIYEGVGWKAPVSSNTPVYRLYNPNDGDHHYTMSSSERNWLVSIGWKYEGIGWYSDDAKMIPLYRQFNPNVYIGTHNYTIDKRENDWLVTLGWKAEGIGWYGTN